MREGLVITLFLFTCSWGLQAQKSKLVAAYNYLEYNELDKAQEAVDAAAIHEKSKNLAKTWYYRGKVYYQLLLNNDPRYKTLSETPDIIAYESFMKLFEFDYKRIDVNEVGQYLKGLVSPLMGRGVQSFNGKDYKKALQLFEYVIEINIKYELVDSIGYYNAGLAAERLGEYEKAIEYYSNCIKGKYGGAKVFANLSDIHLKMKNEKLAMEVLEEGRKLFPNDQELVTNQLNIYLGKDDDQAVIDNLGIAIQNDPTNKTFYFARGARLDKQKNYQDAETDYLKALEIDPDFFDVLYNLGALYYNQGVELINNANNLDLKDVQKGDAMRNIAEEKFVDAIPYLEKAHQIDPSDKSTMISLKKLYARNGNSKKYTEMEEKLKN